MSNEEERRLIENAETVQHADVVTTAVKTDKADVVAHADVIEKVEIHGDPPLSDRARRLGFVRDIAHTIVTLFALLVMIVVIVDNNSDEDNLKDQVQALQDNRTKADIITADKLECTRRYQDVIDEHIENQLILIGEFLVVISQVSPGPERENAVKEKIIELDKTNAIARDSVIAKIQYNNDGNPLPCPLAPSASPPQTKPSSDTTTP